MYFLDLVIGDEDIWLDSLSSSHGMAWPFWKLDKFLSNISTYRHVLIPLSSSFTSALTNYDVKIEK